MVNSSYQELGSAVSVIRKLFAYGLEKAKEIGEENVYDYSLGNPSVPAPKRVNESIVNIVETVDSKKIHGYSVAAGHEGPRIAIAADLKKRYGTEVNYKDIFMTCGAAPALISVIKALTVSPETEIIVISPFFAEYTVFIAGNNAKPVIIPADTEHFQIDLAKVEAAITANTQAIIINSPNNPSGVVYTEETLAQLAELLERKGAEFGHPMYIIADEPYRELVYDGKKVPFIPNIYRNTIVCYSYSKSLSLPGERIGYVYVPSFADDSVNVMFAVSGAARVLGHVCPPTLQQLVVERCAEEMPDLQAYDENRKLLYHSLTEMGYKCVYPDGAFYMIMKALGGDAEEFSERAKLEQNLLLVPTTLFGLPGYVRLSYCVSNDMIKRSLPAFKRLIESYK